MTCKPSTWLGPGAHVDIFPTKVGKALSLEMVGKGCDLEEWHPLARSLAAFAPTMIRREVKDGEALEKWSLDRVVLIGEAAHAMVPYLYQDIATSIEDAVVLGTLLSRLITRLPPASSKLPLTNLRPIILSAYSTLQLRGTTSIAAQSRTQGLWNHLEAGEMQAIRDGAFAEYTGEGGAQGSEVPSVDGMLMMGVLKRDAEGAARGLFGELEGRGLYTVVEGEFRPPARVREALN